MAEDRSRWICGQVQLAFERARAEGGLPFQDVLSSEMVEGVLRELGVTWRECTYKPGLTVGTFLSQVLSADHSCRAAVMQLDLHLVATGQEPISTDTSPYCKARARLPEALPEELSRRVGYEAHRVTRRDPKFLGGRPIKLVDGSTVSMPDTPANQAAYPQPASQKPGLGFPLARFVALICWHSGAVLELAIGPYAGKETGETALLRELLDRLKAGDLLIADRYFCNWWTIALLKMFGVDIICPLHQHRRSDFHRGKRLGFEDHLVEWPKPKRPDWMDAELYAALPEALTVRELRVECPDPTTRVDRLTLVSTLTDPEVYPKEQIAQGFSWRWDAELDLRSIKDAMQMHVLRCQSPEMVRKEIRMHLLAYNLIRTVMVEAAQVYDVQPREISFTGTLQALKAFRKTAVQAPPRLLPALYQELLRIVAQHRVRNRPGRVEPRAVKRRPKPHKLLTTPRHLARTRCPEI